MKPSLPPLPAPYLDSLSRGGAVKKGTGKETDDVLRQKAEDLEATFLSAFFLQPFLESACGKGGLMGGGDVEKSFRPVLAQHLAKPLAGNFGLADSIYKQLLKNQEVSS